RVGVADSGDHRLVAQYALQLRATLPRENHAEALEREVVGERVGTEPGDPRYLGGVAHEVDGETLLAAGLGDIEPRTVVAQHQPCRERPRSRTTGGLRL